MKQIPGFPKYVMSKEGKIFRGASRTPVKRRFRDNNTKGIDQQNRSLRVTLYDISNKPKTRSVISLMAETYLERPNPFVKPTPLDGNWGNTSLSNITWVPIKQKEVPVTKSTLWQRIKHWFKS